MTSEDKNENIAFAPLPQTGAADSLSSKAEEVNIGLAALPPTGGAGSGALFYVSPHVYERIAYRGSTEGVVAIVRAKQRTLEDLSIGLAALPPTGGAGSGALFVILESVEKPGNLGAVLRSADAAGATAVIVCDPLTDLYNPNLIRASIGACFTVPTVACTSEECIRFLKAHGVQILTAQLQDSSLYYDTDMTRPTAIVMGTESTGLTDIWRQAADAHIRIPMLGRLDSLNVSVSAAILLFEAVRQRQNGL
ncbi:MAG: RNA methyltransferase [Bacteroidaceae bacterium]|nr:RNA methyltransferase [Bacteroidaceae bacterium]